MGVYMKQAVTFGKFDQFSSITKADLETREAKIRELKAENELLIEEKNQLHERIKAMNPRAKGAQK